MTTATPTLDILFDGPPGAKSGRFVEAEINGRSVNAGEWVERAPYWFLEIPDESQALNDLARLGAVELFTASLDAPDWRRPDGTPWTITVQGSPHGWGGQSASEAIFEAWRELATLDQFNQEAR
jgi:hypothetical protein